jgi:hypothetical protein
LSSTSSVEGRNRAVGRAGNEKTSNGSSNAIRNCRICGSAGLEMMSNFVSEGIEKKRSSATHGRTRMRSAPRKRRTKCESTAYVRMLIVNAADRRRMPDSLDPMIVGLA